MQSRISSAGDATIRLSANRRAALAAYATILSTTAAIARGFSPVPPATTDSSATSAAGSSVTSASTSTPATVTSTPATVASTPTTVASTTATAASTTATAAAAAQGAAATGQRASAVGLHLGTSTTRTTRATTFEALHLVQTSTRTSTTDPLLRGLEQAIAATRAQGAVDVLIAQRLLARS